MSERVLVCQGRCGGATTRRFDRARADGDLDLCRTLATRLVHTPHTYVGPGVYGDRYVCNRCDTERKF